MCVHVCAGCMAIHEMYLWKTFLKQICKNLVLDGIVYVYMCLCFLNQWTSKPVLTQISNDWSLLCTCISLGCSKMLVYTCISLANSSAFTSFYVLLLHTGITWDSYFISPSSTGTCTCMLVLWYCMLYVHSVMQLKCVFVHLFCDIVYLYVYMYMWCMWYSLLCDVVTLFWIQGAHLHETTAASYVPEHFRVSTEQAKQPASGGVVFCMLSWILSFECATHSFWTEWIMSCGI